MNIYRTTLKNTLRTIIIASICLLLTIAGIIPALQPTAHAAESAIGWEELSSGMENWWDGDASNDLETLIIGNHFGRLRVSTDAGDNWMEVRPGGDADYAWSVAQVSGDGNTMLAGVEGGRLYVSTDAGDNWMEVRPGGDSSYSWSSAAISDNGEVIVATVGGGATYVSVDAGDNWTEEHGYSMWSSAAISGDGQTILVADYWGVLNLSLDAGQTWSDVQPAAPGIDSWMSVSMSSNGHYMLASNQDTGERGIYLSTDSGQTWQEIIPSDDESMSSWDRVGIADNGTNMVIHQGGTLWASEDAGDTWIEAEIPDGAEYVSFISFGDNSEKFFVAPNGTYAQFGIFGELPGFAGGTGTEGDPYQIEDCEQLQNINLTVERLSAHYILNNNIDCSDTANWNDSTGFEPIGTSSTEFYGTLDGNNHVVSDLTINRFDSSRTGLFGEIEEEGYVFDLGLVDVSIEGGHGTGALAGVAYGTVENCYSTGLVNGTDEVGGLVGAHNGYDTIRDSYSTADVNGIWGVGGLVGGNYGNIYNSYATGTVGGESSVGGLVGYSDSEISIEDSYASGDVYGNRRAGGLVGSSYDTFYSSVWARGDVYVEDFGNDEDFEHFGGLIGYADYANVEYAEASGDVIATDENGENVGGLVGYIYEGSVWNVHATGSITTAGMDSVGGLVGYAEYTDVEQSYATGSVVGYEYVGGLVGYSYDADIEESFAKGNVSADSDAGGLVGYMYHDTISDSYALGNVSAEGTYAGGLVGYLSDGDVFNSYSIGAANAQNDAGGLIGYNGDTVYDSFWDIESSGVSESDGGTGKTTAQMKDIATYTTIFEEDEELLQAWDFAGQQNDDQDSDDFWFIDATLNNGYPCLSWQEDDCGSEGVEENAQNDLNGDGINDDDQNHVDSAYNSITGNYVAIEFDTGCVVGEVGVRAETTHSIQDPAYNYPAGLINFSVDCGDPAYTTTVKQYFYGVSASNVVARKYNPNSNAYFTIPGATVSTQTIYGQEVVVATYEVTDGGELDIDGEVNGVIVDPAGIASQVIGSPNTGIRRQ